MSPTKREATEAEAAPGGPLITELIDDLREWVDDDVNVALDEILAEVERLREAIREARDYIPDDDHPADVILAAALAGKRGQVPEPSDSANETAAPGSTTGRNPAP